MNLETNGKPGLFLVLLFSFGRNLQLYNFLPIKAAKPSSSSYHQKLFCGFTVKFLPILELILYHFRVFPGSANMVLKLGTFQEFFDSRSW